MAIDEKLPLLVHIEGSGGPGTRCMAWSAVEVSVQVGKAWVAAAAGDVAVYRHSVPISAVRVGDALRWRGPAVYGPTDDRFLYLVWTGISGVGPREMFRRAKLKLTRIPVEVLDSALASGEITVSVPLTACDGTPTCGTPSTVVWRV